MRKYIMHIGLIVIAMITFSCNKESFNYKPGYIATSKITYYPSVTLTGDTYMVIQKGGSFADPGASATAGGKSLKVVTSGTVNTNVVGIYLVNYTATNSDGFPATATRYIAVYSTDATAQNNDFSGDYLRASTGATATWTKLAPGVYTIHNPGGAVGNGLIVFAFNQTGYQISIPSQIAGGSPTSSAKESTVPGTAPGTLASYKMEIINPGFGTSVRSFTKQ